MKKILLVLLSTAVLAPSALGQDWSIGVGAGPFVFGQFVERTTKITTGEGSDTQTVVLSAGTRAGLTVDIERSLSERFAVRLEGSFTRAPLGIKGKDRQDESVDIPAGDIDVTAVTLPLLIRINPRGTFRFHVHGGPALALYRLETRENATGAEPAFEGMQQEWGLAFGGGVAWWLSERFAVEGNLTDIVTSSPIDRADLPDVPGINVPRPHNVHTTVGIRWTF